MSPFSISGAAAVAVAPDPAPSFPFLIKFSSTPSAVGCEDAPPTAPRGVEVFPPSSGPGGVCVTPLPGPSTETCATATPTAVATNPAIAASRHFTSRIKHRSPFNHLTIQPLNQPHNPPQSQSSPLYQSASPPRQSSSPAESPQTPPHAPPPPSPTATHPLHTSASAPHP